MSLKLPFWATTLTIIGLGILCTLGTWQLKRLAWKEDILQKLNTAYEGNQSTPLDFTALQENNTDYAYGQITGTFKPDKAILLGPITKNKEIGKNLIVPVITDQGTVFINMGWTDQPLESLPIHHVQNKNIRIEGLARKPGWNTFTPNNEPQNDLWFKPDLNEISEIKDLKNPIPYMLYAQSTSYKFDAAFPNNDRWQPNNDHLQYAIFWFTMACALLVIYILRFTVKKKP